MSGPEGTLPIAEALPALREALRAGNAAVLVAPPGAGKTTGVPLALLDEPWLGGGRILMQEPRRIAARAAARRMAQALGEDVGATVGYRVRFDSRVGPRTRIEVMTDGLFLRRLQDDPGLDGVACVIFDELHERGLETDLALALTREAQLGLRPDLRLVAMSATLDPGPVAALLGDAPVVQSEGRMFPVATRYLEREPQERIEDTVAAAIRRALATEPGSLLVFLPGIGEIRGVLARLEAEQLPDDVGLAPLYGDLAAADQDRAIRPASPGRRKVVLSTAIAETSLTIEGVRVVIDCGLMRRPQFSPRTGMSRLVTTRVSQASADQRRGRAGRLAPGTCLRLWTEPQQRGLLPFSPPEIVDADLAPLALELAAWGVRDIAALAWLTLPPAAAMAQARDLLRTLQAIDADGAITPHGKRMVRIGLHPRLAHMLLRGAEAGDGRLAAILAAVLGERDILARGPGRPPDPDLRHRVEIVVAAQERRPTRESAVDRGSLRLVLEAARRFERALGVAARDQPVLERTGALLALAYPDRVGQRRGERRYRLAGGGGAILPEAAGTPPDHIAVGELGGTAIDSQIYSFAPLTAADLEILFADRIVTEERVGWDSREAAVVSETQRRLGNLVLDRRALTRIDTDRLRLGMLEGIRSLGLDALPWTDDARGLRDRMRFLNGAIGAPWPDVSDAALLESLDAWLGPFLDGMTRRAHLERLDLATALRGRLPWPLPRELDTLAPTHIEVPSGSRIRVDYSAASGPLLAVRLQEVFGLVATPAILAGRHPLTLHLLSPARRPVQVTRDLASFWRAGYRDVRAELKGRYPKHFWPEDPLTAPPTSRVRPH